MSLEGKIAIGGKQGDIEFGFASVMIDSLCTDLDEVVEVFAQGSYRVEEDPPGETYSVAKSLTLLAPRGIDRYQRIQAQRGCPFSM